MNFIKMLLASLLLAVCPFSSNALRRIIDSTPVLHSVFDKDTPDNALPPKANTGGADRWSQRVSLNRAKTPDYLRKYEAPHYEIRRRGIKLTVAGGTAFSGGAAVLLYGLSANGQQIRAPVYGYSALAMIIVGTIMTLIGMPMWLSHI